MAMLRETEEDDYGDERSRAYRAAGGSKRTPMVLVIPPPHVAAEDRLFPYAHIQQVLLKKDGESLAIELPYMTLLLTGKNLRAVALALGAHACSRLEAFDPERRDLPKSPDEPFIATIEYLVRKADKEERRPKTSSAEERA